VSVFLRSLIALLLLGLACEQGHAADNKRIALIIANRLYQNTPALKNPSNDAEAVAEKLHELGFEVQVETNLDAKGLSRAIQGFSSKLDKNTDALFYYAGHGLEYFGENYLVAVDAKLQSEATVQFETFRLNTVRSLIEQKASTTLIFWDGCRNNPLANGLVATRLSVRMDASPAVRASAPIPPSSGDTLVVFSAEPGKFAIDGQGDLSPFAESLIKFVATPNIEISSMLTRVTADVLAKTKNAQKPQVLSGLAKEFYFKQQREDEQFAYKQEIDTLRAKIALLERQPAREAHFEIISSEARNKQQSPVTDVAPAPNTTGTSPSVADTDSKNPAKQTSPAATPAEPLDHPAQPSGSETSTKQETAAAQQPASNPPGDATDKALGKQELNVVVSVNLDQTTIVRKLRIAPDGKLLAIGSDDGIVRIVDLDTFEIVQAIHAHTGRVSDIDFAPDSQTLLSAGRDGFLRFWNARDGQKLRPDLQVSGSVPYTARFNPAFPDRYVLMGDREGRLLAWDLARGGKVIVNAKFHNGAVQSVAYQPGGKGTYLSAGADGLLKVRLPEGQRYVANAHAGTIFAAGFNHDGKLIYTAGYDRKIKIWDPTTLSRKDPLAVLEGHLKYVLAAAISQDGKMLASGGGDKAVDLWDVASRKLVGRLLGHTSDIEALEFTPNNRFVISSSEDRTVRIWSVDGHKELVRMFFRADSGKFAGVTCDNKSFGDKDAGVMTVFIDGRAVAGSKAEDALTYVGHGISVVNAQR